jgi:transcriptional regulator
MRRNPVFTMTDPQEVKRLIRRNPWATFVSMTSKGLVASHYPVLLDEEASQDPDEIVIVSHFGRPDERYHELGDKDLLVIVQGPHDYVSSSWYPPEYLAPTWNHLSAHLHGVPEILDEEQNFQWLSRLTDHFERHYEGGRSLQEDEAAARELATGAVSIRMRVTRFHALAKLSQNKPAEVQANVREHLAESNPALTAEMERVRGAEA